MEYLQGIPLAYNTDLLYAAKIFANIHSIPIDYQDPQGFIVETNVCTDRIHEVTHLLSSVWDSEHIHSKVKHVLLQVLEYAKEHEKKQQYYLDNPLWCINNTEVNSNNFIMNHDTKKYFLIDWEKAVISDPCQDITQFLAKTTTLWKTSSILTTQQQEDFFKAYEQEYTAITGVHTTNIRERVALYRPYLHLRAISWCAYAFVAYQDPNKSIVNNDTYQK